MNGEDIDAVLAIEGSAPSPWSREHIVAECERPQGINLVAVSATHAIVGWCCGFHAGPEAELLKIAVAPKWRKHGIAEALLLELCRLSAESGANEIFLEVRSQNLAAVQLYRKLGWRQSGRRTGYYREPPDDAIIFRRML